MQPDSPHVMFAVVFVVALLVGVFLVFAPEIDMGWLRRRVAGDDLLPAAARQLARTVCRTAAIHGALAVAALCGVLATASSTAAAFAGLGAGLVLAREGWLLARAHRMVRLLDAGATCRLHGDHVLCVRAAGASSWLVCSQRQLATATECVLPLARARAAR